MNAARGNWRIEVCCVVFDMNSNRFTAMYELSTKFF